MSIETKVEFDPPFIRTRITGTFSNVQAAQAYAEQLLKIDPGHTADKLAPQLAELAIHYGLPLDPDALIEAANKIKAEQKRKRLEGKRKFLQESAHSLRNDVDSKMRRFVISFATEEQCQCRYAHFLYGVHFLADELNSARKKLRNAVYTTGAYGYSGYYDSMDSLIARLEKANYLYYIEYLDGPHNPDKDDE